MSRRAGLVRAADAGLSARSAAPGPGARTRHCVLFVATDAWVAALVIMGLATVLARLVVLGMRARKLPAAIATTPDPAPAQG